MPASSSTGLTGLRRRVHSRPDHRRLLLVTCLLGMFSTTFPITILAVSFKRIADDMGTTPSTIAWASTAPMLAAAVSTPILGRLGDLRGHRRLFLTGFSISIVFAILTSLAWNPATLITFRTLGQLAGTATVPASLAMLFRAHGPEDRVRVSAWASSILAAAAVSGLVIGGPLTEAFGWRLIFILQGSLSLVALLAALVVLRPGDQELQEGAVDWPGAALLALTAFSATFAVNRLPLWGPTPLVLALIAIFPIALITFLRVERRAATPILPLALFQNRDIRLAIVASALVGAGWAGAFIITPILMQAVIGLSVAQSSLASFPRATFAALAGPVAARIGMRRGERAVALVALVGLSGTMGLLAIASASRSVALVVVAIAAGGWCFGHASPALMSMVSGAVEARDLGVATSLQQTGSQIGSVFGNGLLTAVAADATTPHPFVLSYLGAGALALLAAAVIFKVRGNDLVISAITPGDDGFMDATPVAPEQVHHRAQD